MDHETIQLRNINCSTTSCFSGGWCAPQYCLKERRLSSNSISHPSMRSAMKLTKFCWMQKAEVGDTLEVFGCLLHTTWDQGDPGTIGMNILLCTKAMPKHPATRGENRWGARQMHASVCNSLWPATSIWWQGNKKLVGGLKETLKEILLGCLNPGACYALITCSCAEKSCSRKSGRELKASCSQRFAYVGGIKMLLNPPKWNAGGGKKSIFPSHASHL